jgi:hypothetical protein
MAKPKNPLIAVLAALLLALSLVIPVMAHGPQPLPLAACNEGTMTAHGSLGPNAAGHDRIRHGHDGGVTCVHLNPSVH